MTSKPAPGAGDDARVDQFDGLRVLAFLSVFAHHALHEPLLWAGVDLFVLLSGFLITGILLRQRGSPHFFRSFYYRRFLRIFPPYYLLLAVAWLTDASCGVGMGWHLLYLSNVFYSFFGRSCTQIQLTWSLAVEEQFYLVWPLFVWLLGERGMTRLCVALLVSTPLVRLGLTFVWHHWFAVYMLLPTRVDLLAAGAALVILSRRAPEVFRRVSDAGPRVAGAGTAVFVALAALDPRFRTGANAPLFNVLGYSLIGVVAAGIVAYTAVRRDNLYFRVLTARPIVFLGRISYMLYLCHQLVLVQTRRLHLPKPLEAAVALAAAIACSTVSWFLLEKPLQRLKDRRPAPSEAAAPS